MLKNSPPNECGFTSAINANWPSAVYAKEEVDRGGEMPVHFCAP
jgi:hypothetical protein